MVSVRKQLYGATIQPNRKLGKVQAGLCSLIVGTLTATSHEVTKRLMEERVCHELELATITNQGVRASASCRGQKKQAIPTFTLQQYAHHLFFQPCRPNVGCDFRLGHGHKMPRYLYSQVPYAQPFGILGLT